LIRDPNQSKPAYSSARSLQPASKACFPRPLALNGFPFSFPARFKIITILEILSVTKTIAKIVIEETEILVHKSKKL
jgi:hypothetical protein